MSNLFDAELISAEREVRDLRTAHAIPVGSLNFYHKTANVTTPSGIVQGVYIRVTNKDGEPNYSYQQVRVVRMNGAENYNWQSEVAYVRNGTIVQYYYPLKGGQTYEISVTNTSDFDLVAKNYENEDWLDD